MARSLYILLMSAPLILMGTIIANPDNNENSGLQSVHAAAPLAARGDLKKEAKKHLDELNEMMVILYHMISKGRVKISNKAVAMTWLHTLVPAAGKAAKKTVSMKTMAFTAQVLINHLFTALDTDFKEINPFIEVADDAEDKPEEYNAIAALIDANKTDIETLHDKIHNYGLSSINLWARAVDEWNDTYQFTWYLEQAPRMLAVAGTALYLTPYNKIKNWPIIGYLKKWIGTPVSYDKEGHTELTVGSAPAAANIPSSPNNLVSDFCGTSRPALAQVQPESSKKFTLSEFRGSLDYKLFKDLAGFAAGFIVSNSAYSQALSPLKTSFRNFWKQLKGYDLPRDSYSYKFPDKTLDDKELIGLEEQVAQMRSIVDYMINPEAYDKISASIEKGILLTGPSRTGKTLLAKALAGSLTKEMNKRRGLNKRVAFKQVRAAEIVASRDGIKSVIEDARNHAPCILFIDEVHNLPLQTKEGGDTLSEFLTMADALNTQEANDGVIVMAATNRAYMLDDALLKPERFGMVIHFENPTFEKRREFFLSNCQQHAISLDDIDIDALARQTEGKSYGDLNSVFNQVRVIYHSRKMNKESGAQEVNGIKQEDFDNVIQTQIFRFQTKRTLPLTPQARKCIAAHQAGHALMYALHEEETQATIETVTIRGKWRKITETRWNDPKIREEHTKKKTSYGHVVISNKSEAVALETDPVMLAKIKLSGALAEELILGKRNYGYHTKDRRKALDYLEKIVFGGLNKEDFSLEEQKEPMMQAKAMLQRCEQEVRQFLAANKHKLIKLADALEKEETLTRAQVRVLLGIDKQ